VISTTGIVSEYPISGTPDDIAVGPNGDLWFTEYYADKIGRLDPVLHVLHEYAVAPGSHPYLIAKGPDGAIWFTEDAVKSIGRIDPATATEAVPGIIEHSVSAIPYDIVSGPDSSLWFTEPTANMVSRLTTAGVLTDFAAGISSGSTPGGIALGPDNNLWFSEHGTGGMARITTVATTSPFVLLSSPADAFRTHDTQPTFTGLAATGSGVNPTITVDVEKSIGNGAFTQTTITNVPVNSDGTWTARYPSPLGDAEYVWRAYQDDSSGHRGVSVNRALTIDTTAPAVTINHPQDRSAWALDGFGQIIRGLAGRAVGDNATITVDVSSNPPGKPFTHLETVTAQATGQTVDGAHAYWAVDLTGGGALGPGRYTATASQHDDVGNVRETSSTWTILPSTADTVKPTPGGGTTITVYNPTAGATVTGQSVTPCGPVTSSSPTGGLAGTGCRISCDKPPPINDPGDYVTWWVARCADRTSTTLLAKDGKAHRVFYMIVGTTVLRHAKKGLVKLRIVVRSKQVRKLVKAALKRHHSHTFPGFVAVVIAAPHGGRPIVTVRRTTLHF
jgi:hypothetical protein